MVDKDEEEPNRSDIVEPGLGLLIPMMGLLGRIELAVHKQMRIGKLRERVKLAEMTETERAQGARGTRTCLGR